MLPNASDSRNEEFCIWLLPQSARLHQLISNMLESRFALLIAVFMAGLVQPPTLKPNPDLGALLFPVLSG